MGKWTWFTDDEARGLNDEFVTKLDQARGLANTPFVITSGLRTLSENQSIPGAVPDSSHLLGLAVDLAVDSSGPRFAVVKALIQVGFTRIGIYEKHIHVDDSKTLLQNVMWYVCGS